jgi:hypothetical protein
MAIAVALLFILAQVSISVEQSCDVSECSVESYCSQRQPVCYGNSTAGNLEDDDEHEIRCTDVVAATLRAIVCKMFLEMFSGVNGDASEPQWTILVEPPTPCNNVIKAAVVNLLAQCLEVHRKVNHNVAMRKREQESATQPEWWRALFESGGNLTELESHSVRETGRWQLLQKLINFIRAADKLRIIWELVEFLRYVRPQRLPAQ